MSDIPIFEAELVLECGNNLGEGVLWDAHAQVVRWIDIDEPAVHSYDPSTGAYSVDAYAESAHLSNIALVKSNPEELVATIQHDIVILPASKPTRQPSDVKPVVQKSLRTIAQPLSKPFSTQKEVRFNDGGCDPRGRLFAGSMNIGEAKDNRSGELLRIDPDGTRTQILEPGTVGTSNGIGWSPDGKLMYYIDSGEPEVSVFDYDLETGTPSNRRTFAGKPPAMDELGTRGVFDGLCVDGVGNVWVARWRERRIIGYTPEGKIFAYVKCPGALLTTIPCFGGENLDTMYIATARASRVGEKVEDYPASGHLFKMDFGPKSAIRKILGDNWKGADKHAFGI
ncbi:hypothetical protein BD324DRAFT_618477 [Kockovaella imperatae]|uniref:SMP-30/Gluconolactonase/LRE-like region domain-containing protein n=1 Tax=Kockovaella imperatae TaxID=4999 RepID=A0A1Y1UM00_9TREE|nr:hypothetical protein BD324DRAFT_618477 [Kockovaella imperatae]ORX39088.1 hypothetical protein BD324DRAFT_618477 [Kockovaella imperatae]